MNLYDSISQSDLNDVIDLLLGNYHKELNLSLDDPVNGYCGLSFECTGVDAGEEFILNSDDVLRVFFSDARLANLGYSLRLFYYQLDKGDIDGSKGYGDLQSVLVDLDDDVVVVPFSVDQVYLQKGFDLVLLSNTGSRLSLVADKTLVQLDESVVLTATFISGGEPVSGESVSFYDGESLVGTVVTGDDGTASLTLSDLDIGSHSFSASCDGTYSKNVSVNVISDIVMSLTVTGSSFSTYSSAPFEFNGKLFVDWGDDTGLVEYSGGKLSHDYSSSGEYEVLVYGNITSLGTGCFGDCSGLTSISLPDSVTRLGNSCFGDCSGLTNITIPDSVTRLGNSCFRSCTGLTNITIPDSVTSLGNYCFLGCTGLTSIILQWNNPPQNYNSTWITNSPAIFSIPHNTTTNYTNKQYPQDKINERGQ